MTRTLPEYLTQNADYSITIRLSRPYEFSGEKRDKLTLREPTADDQLNFLPPNGVSPIELATLERKLFSSLGDGFTPDELGKLSLKDTARITTAFGFFVD